MHGLQISASKGYEMFGEASRFVIAKIKAPAFNILFEYVRQEPFSFDIAWTLCRTHDIVTYVELSEGL